MAFEFIARQLAKRREGGLYRQTQRVNWLAPNQLAIEGHRLCNFASNDYLGIGQSESLREAWQQALNDTPPSASASPLVCGYTDAHLALEQALSQWLGYESVMLFNSGFAANQAICSALAQGDIRFFADKLIHASCIEGMQQSGRPFRRFAHNDAAQLNRLLNAQSEDMLVLTEGIFSMDGDTAPLAELAKVTGHHGAWLVVDEAHSLGVCGEQGRGACHQQGLSSSQVPILMGTFGKALGTSGAFVAASAEVIDFIRNSARHYIYSTHMPAHQALATLHAVDMVKSDAWRRTALQQNIAHFRQHAELAGLKLMPSDSAIQPIVVGDNQRVMTIASMLKQNGFLVGAMRSPTVSKGTERLRITLNARHNHNEINQLIETIGKAWTA